MRRSSSSSSISSQWSTASEDTELGQLTSIVPVASSTTAATTITSATTTSTNTTSNSSIISSSASVAATSNSNSNNNNNMPERRPSFPDYDERSRQGSTCSIRSCGGMSPDATRELWKTMLELQERYGCYTSARMDMAVGAGDMALSLMPNPFILDTLNDSVVDLPDEGWEMLNRCLQQPRL
ncbi:hypothetical protein MKX07_004046 [Trichoderma sp. CBMAI-0711]|uniref:Uncharacterized protein n=1 Tax=Trichoderma parareesei TaxID=858221 RepID=A0A2H2ZW13_TRIPA|nr:hypothetical protein MKX07_004046 [Trichoderma sp. CBMAI-0711]OTA04171.1 hypothetical protein A9Z42_0047370 [Trichoderma parareesei]